jgi:CRISPR/Cas system-associated protein Cas7 (RAMP superfamily)
VVCPRLRLEDNIKIDLHEVGYGGMDWIGLAQDRHRWRELLDAVMNLRVPYNAGNFFTSCKPVSFLRRTVLYGVSRYVKKGKTFPLQA